MAFCTFKTADLLEVGTIVKKNGPLVTPFDNIDHSLIVGVVANSYQDEDTQIYYAKIHISGVTCAKLKFDWNGEFYPITVDGNLIKVANENDKYFGYLIPQLPQVSKTSGEFATVYWRGVIS